MPDFPHPILKCAVVACTLVLCPFICRGQRVVEDFDFDWKFSKVEQDAEQGFELAGFDDSGWEVVQTPHDWNIKDDFDLTSSGSAASLPDGIGWYRKWFKVPSSMKGKNLTILFDGISQTSDVYINGHHLGTHPYGFTSVHYDLTPYIQYGKENLIAVRSSTLGGRPRWYGGGGIYRHVRLIYTSPVHIDIYGTFVTTPVIAGDYAEVNVQLTLVNPENLPYQLSNRILDADGQVVAYGRTCNLSVPSPHLWDVDDPYLYTLETTVKVRGRIVDKYETVFGIRYFAFDRDKGFSLNGNPLKIKGVCLHQDAGSLGVAIPDRSNERKLEIFREYGANAVRMSHNPPSADLLDMCDRLGFLVLDEALDKWKSGYYEAVFDEWWQADVGDMLLRDRNHPSIIIWGIGNEVAEAWLDDSTGVERAAMLQDFVHKTDPTRPVTVACQNNHKAHFAGVTDIAGYNYLEARAISEHKIYPERKIVITEELPYWCGAEGNIRAYSSINPWNYVRDNDFIAGGFIWCGVDYLGEAQSWNSSRGWPNGLFDVCMFEKPRASYHRAVWNDEPMVRVAVRDNSLDVDFGRDLWQWPSIKDDWTYPESCVGKMMDVQTVTNCEEVELYSGGKLMGRHRTSDFINNTIEWHLPYSHGELKALGYIGGAPVCEHSIFTTGEIVDFTVEPDREILKADGQDLCHLTVTLVDAAGHRVQVDERDVRVSVSGAGRLLTVDSGDLRVAAKSFVRESVKTQYGRVLAVVQSAREAGDIKVSVRVDGFDAVKTVTVSSVPYQACRRPCF